MPVRPPVIVQQDSDDTAAQCYKAGDKGSRTQTERRTKRMLLKLCRCGRLIPQSIKMCEQCEAAEQERSRHVIYNETRRDSRAAEFYISKEWRTMRPIIVSVYDSIDIYALYVLGKLKVLSKSDPIHHIIELEDDWSKRLDPFNLLPASHETHNTITALYKKDKATMKATQAQIRDIIAHHFKEAGGIEKVLYKAGLVAPPPSL